MTAGLRRIGILPDLAARPLFSRFREPDFEVVRDLPGSLGIRLRERQLDGAFLSPVDAARSPRGIRAAGGGCLVARAGSNTARLLFREGLRSVRTVSADPARISEIVLAHVVLAEQYDTVPQIVPRRDTAGDPLHGCDAALLAGDEALDGEGLDLVEEWADIAELPFVHGLWYVGADPSGNGASSGDDAAAPPRPREYSIFDCDAPGSGAISYRFDGEARAGAAEFIRMAYYHGVLKEIPEPHAFLPDAVP